MEVAAIMGGGKEERQPGKLYYRNQGGWDGCTWGGVYRSFFVFSDSLQAGGYLHAREGEGKIYASSAAMMATTLPNQYFAGIVCVAD